MKKDNINNTVKQVIRRLAEKGYKVTDYFLNRNLKIIKIFCSRDDQNFCIKFYVTKMNSNYVIEGYTVEKLKNHLWKHNRKKFILD